MLPFVDKDTNFTIVINIIDHFLKNHAQILNDYYFEMDGVDCILLILMDE